MKLDSSTLEFVRTGLERYPDARDTVRFFEETIYASIVDALQQRTWHTFRPSTSLKGGLAISKNKGETFLHGWIEGSTGRQSRIRFVYLGLYWEDPVVAAVGLWDEKWKKLSIKPPSSLDHGIWFNPSDQSLSLHVGKDFEPERDFNRLLDALEQSMASAA